MDIEPATERNSLRQLDTPSQGVAEIVAQQDETFALGTDIGPEEGGQEETWRDRQRGLLEEVPLASLDDLGEHLIRPVPLVGRNRRLVEELPEDLVAGLELRPVVEAVGIVLEGDRRQTDDLHVDDLLLGEREIEELLLDQLLELPLAATAGSSFDRSTGEPVQLPMPVQ